MKDMDLGECPSSEEVQLADFPITLSDVKDYLRNNLTIEVSQKGKTGKYLMIRLRLENMIISNDIITL